MKEIEDMITEFEGVTGISLSEEDRSLLADFIASGCRRLCEQVV
jgi:hypothetical protein